MLDQLYAMRDTIDEQIDALTATHALDEDEVAYLMSQVMVHGERCRDLIERMEAEVFQ